MAFELPPLPYAPDALAPHISGDTVGFHYDKHHRGYVTKVNEMTDGTAHANAALEDVVRASYESNAGLFNNAAQAWNHVVYWNGMKPEGGGAPTGHIADKITEDFGSYDAFKDQFSNAGATQFGSGWAWLIYKDGKLAVRQTPNGVNPLVEDGAHTILGLDVWEHAYYLDYQNLRPKYIAAWLENLVNWDYASDALNKAAS